MAVRISGVFWIFFARERSLSISTRARTAFLGGQHAVPVISYLLISLSNFGIPCASCSDFCFFWMIRKRKFATHDEWNGFKQGFDTTKHSCFIFFPTSARVGRSCSFRSSVLLDGGHLDTFLSHALHTFPACRNLVISRYSGILGSVFFLLSGEEGVMSIYSLQVVFGTLIEYYGA